MQNVNGAKSVQVKGRKGKRIQKLQRFFVLYTAILGNPDTPCLSGCSVVLAKILVSELQSMFTVLFSFHRRNGEKQKNKKENCSAGFRSSDQGKSSRLEKF